MITKALTEVVARIEIHSGNALVQRGTGFLIAPEFAVTALHVVADRSVSPPAKYADKFTLRFGEALAEATVVRYDTEKDWALLRLETACKSEPIQLARLDRPVERCWMWGFAELNSLNGKTFTGEVLRVDAAFGNRSPMLEIDSRNAQGAPIGGLSGGPCLVQGKAVGIVQANLEENRRNIAGALYALPIEVLVAGCRDLLPALGLVELEWPRPNAPHQAERPPPWFVETSQVGEIAECVIATLKDGAKPLAPIAIWGAGGSGKTTVAAAVAAAVDHVFPDGVLWTRLGRTEEGTDTSHGGSLLVNLGAWVQEFDPGFIVRSIDATSRHLRSLLADRRCLLVIDDAWESDTVQHFLVGGAKCRTLVTTRRRDVAESLGGKVFERRELRPEESLALLASRLARPLKEEELRMATKVAQMVGHLPLALVQVATAVARGKSWSRIAEDLGAEVSRLESIEPLASRRRSESGLEAILNMSLNGLRDYRDGDRLHVSFAWLGATHEDTDLTVGAAARLWETDEQQAHDWLEILWNDAMLIRSELAPAAGERRAYRLHDLWLDRARRLLTDRAPGGYGIDLRSAHAAVLDRYARLCSVPGAWWTLPDDGYIFDHLPWHLARAGRSEALHELLAAETKGAGNAWFDVLERTGRLHRYLAHIDAGWEALGSSSDDVLTTERELRYTLAIASLNSGIAGMPPGWIVRMVAEGTWTGQEAIIHASRLSDHRDRARALTGLLPHLDDHQRSWVAFEAARSAFIMGPNASAVEWMREEVPLLLGPLGQWMDAALRKEVLELLFVQEEPMAALTALVPTLPEAELTRVLEFAVRRGYDKETTKLLGAIKLRLPIPQLETLVDELTTARLESASAGGQLRALREIEFRLELLAISDLQVRTPDVQRLAASLPLADWYAPTLVSIVAKHASNDTVLAPLVDAVLAVENSYTRGKALEELASRLTRDDVRRVLERIGGFTDDYLRSSMISAIRAGIPPDLVLPAAKIARSLGDAGLRAAALAELSARADPETADDLRGEALGISRSDALVALLPNVRVDEMAEALDALATRDDETQAKKLLASSAVVPEDLLPKALELAMRNAQATQLLRGLEERLSDELVGRAIDGIHFVTDQKVRRNLLVALAPRLSGDTSAEVLKALLEDQGLETRERLVLLQRVAPYVTDEVLREVCLGEYVRAAEVLAVAPALKGDILKEALFRAIASLKVLGERREEWGEVLETLGERADVQLLVEGLRRLREIGDQVECSRALLVLAPHLDEGGREQALNVALAVRKDYIGFETERSKAIVALARYLSPALLERALAGVRSIDWEGDRLDGLVGLLPLFDGRRRQDLAWEAFELALVSEMVGKYAGRIVPSLEEQRVSEAVHAIVTASRDAEARARCLADVASSLSGPKRAALFEMAVDYGRQVERKVQRRRLFKDLAPGLPESLRVTVEELADWRPEPTESATPPRGPEVALDEALAFARVEVDPLHRMIRLAALVGRAPEPLRKGIVDESLDCIVAFGQHRENLGSMWLDWFTLEDALRLLEPYASPAAREAMLDIARSLQRPDDRAEALAAVSRHADPQTRSKSLIEAFRSVPSLARLIPDLEGLEQESKRLLWQHALVVLDAHTRAQYVSDVVRLLPSLCPIGGAAGARAAAKTILEAVEWWP